MLPFDSPARPKHRVCWRAAGASLELCCLSSLFGSAEPLWERTRVGPTTGPGRGPPRAPPCCQPYGLRDLQVDTGKITTRSEPPLIPTPAPDPHPTPGILADNRNGLATSYCPPPPPLASQKKVRYLNPPPPVSPPSITAVNNRYCINTSTEASCR